MNIGPFEPQSLGFSPSRAIDTERLRAETSESFTGCVALSTFMSPSKPQLPHLENEEVGRIPGVDASKRQITDPGRFSKKKKKKANCYYYVFIFLLLLTSLLLFSLISPLFDDFFNGQNY